MSAQSLPSNVKKEYRALGIYQIFGGAIGFVVTGWSLLSGAESGAVVALIILSLLTYGFSIVSGIYCINLQAVGLASTIINQTLQVLWFAVFGISFKYGAGLYIVVGGDFTESFDFILNVGVSNLKLAFSRRSNEIAFSVNVVAIWVMSRAMHTRKFLTNNVEA